MISIHSLEQIETPAPALDPKVSRVMDVIEPGKIIWKRLCDGTEEPWVFLRKPLPGLPSGTCIRLRDLHERIQWKGTK